MEIDQERFGRMAGWQLHVPRPLVSEHQLLVRPQSGKTVALRPCLLGSPPWPLCQPGCGLPMVSSSRASRSGIAPSMHEA